MHAPQLCSCVRVCSMLHALTVAQKSACACTLLAQVHKKKSSPTSLSRAVRLVSAQPVPGDKGDSAAVLHLRRHRHACTATGARHRHTCRGKGAAAFA